MTMLDFNGQTNPNKFHWHKILQCIFLAVENRHISVTIQNYSKLCCLHML